MEYDKVLASRELSEIIRSHNSALEMLKEFKERYPYLIAPNVIDSMTHRSKDNVAMLYLEFSKLHPGAPNKMRKQHVCTRCHKVFYVTLPKGLCDECRAKG